MPAMPTNETQVQLVRARDLLDEVTDLLGQAADAYRAGSTSAATGFAINAISRAVVAQSAAVMAINELAVRVDGIEQVTGIEVVPARIG